MNLTAEEKLILCEEAGDIHHSWKYNIVLGCVIIVNISAMILLINTFIFLVKTRKICFNLRLLLLSLTLAIIIRTLLTTFRASHRIIRAIVITDPCDFLSTLFTCMLESSVQSIPFSISLYSFPMIAIERFIATIFRNIYERRFFSFFICCGIIASWVYSIFFYWNLVASVKEINLIVSYCSSIIKIDEIHVFSIIFDIQFLEPLFSVIVNLGVWLFCKSKKESFFKFRATSHSLNDRYNLSEIIRTSRIVLLLCSSFCILHMLYQIFLCLAIMYFEVNTLRRFSVVKEISSLCVMPLFANVYGITFYYLQKCSIQNNLPTNNIPIKQLIQSLTKFHINRRNKSLVSPLTTTTTPTSATTKPSTAQSDTYFNIYANSWK